MIRNLINEIELENVLNNFSNQIEDMKQRHVEYLNYKHSRYAFRPPEEPTYELNFAVDFKDKHYKGIKCFYLEWPRMIKYEQILKVYNIESNHQMFYSFNFLNQVFSYYSMDFVDDIYTDSSGLLRFRIKSNENKILFEIEDFFRTTHKMMMESLHIIKSVKDFY